MSLNLGSILENSTRFFGAETALISDHERLTYSELRSHVMAFALALRQTGVRPGDKVAVMLPNCMTFTIAYFGILYAGAVVVPISYLAVEREIAYALNDSEAVLFVASTGFAERAEPGFAAADGATTLLLVDESDGPLTVRDGDFRIEPGAFFDLTQSSPQDTAVILYTSGTTGEPKGAELTHLNLFSNAQYSCERIFWIPHEKTEFLGPGHVVIAALPLFHSFGQTCNQNAALFGGAALTYLEKFDADQALSVMERDRVTLFTGVPTMYFQLLQTAKQSTYDLSNLKFCMSGGAAMPVEVMREFDSTYGVKILEGYGLSETSPVATFNVLFRPRKPGSIGQAIFGVDVRIIGSDDHALPPGEVGEIVIRGPNVMKGYYRRPEATANALRNGWLHTGDMGHIDDDGYITIVDRKKDLIIRGGFNVYPREVEEILYSHDAVYEAAVVGTPDEQYGEEIKAFVAVQPGASLTADELVAFCKDRLGAHKYPRLVEFLESLPKGPTGKILKKELRQSERPAASG